MTRSTPEGLYQEGYKNYQDGSYKKAIQSFQKLKEEYPLSQLAILAEIGIADSYLSDGEYDDAAVAYTEFINLHPLNENLPYAVYQLGMCHYKQMLSIDRDQMETERAKKEFEKLISRFPNSKFSLMAEQMIRECKKSLGEHEFYVGRIYFKMKKYKAALKRFETIKRDYANLGLDEKTDTIIGETKKRIAKTEDSEKNK